MTGMKKIVPFYHSLNGNTEEDKILLDPVEYSLQCNDTHIYRIIPFLFNYWFKVSPDKFQLIDEIAQMAFNIMVVFDDIQDEAIVRNGFPVTHSVYGLHNSINAANYLQLITCEKLINLHPMAVKIFVEQLMEFYKGQGMDIYWKENFICPTEKDYNIVAVKKSGWLAILVVKLMKLFSTYEEDVLSLASTLGLYRQIYDDYSNLRYDKDINENSYCDDLTEGKMSFLIIHALRNNPDDKKIINILRQRSKNIEVKRYCVKVLESYGSFKYAKEVLDELEKKIRTEIDRLGGNPIFVKLMDDVKNNMLKTRI
ncbi:PREDICTED: geranylgeranyl pyrophosphate synthase-like [Trachymyrmex cornetzi]|uniref:geranylgeranyl pyrophosphate synthase-like n=1 Tax=Trachymyrmex cornetzi TaxID=471704 RepID=UPI00084F09EA|nr:PREDICTED: geranylgeranyl pyrophosphate synthase-like [Trachymyrmex cornetzi]XP_018364819.1 PREDICTED: geranylgeranyl pyrophosphate synthase-like [Trachymyrmex cornetzi]XP_018364827.1 PREDICTED: geranylgeranyl pyrophosphate synthase-like [Trachymyrmex cornetzi]XP_018364836.1 PREDICTED: geranylgeranyl pyrophosphate synthase-like [Trachymyrmex cornetzi]